MIEQRWLLLLVGWALVAVLQGALYLRQRSTRNATLVDAGWAFSLRGKTLCSGLWWYSRTRTTSASG